jgi:hypothetical protein
MPPHRQTRVQRRLLAWAAALAACALSSLAAAQDLPKPADLSPCAPNPDLKCVPVRLYVALDGGGPVQDAPWIERQLHEARWRFAPLGLDLQVVQILALPRDLAELTTPQDRDRLAAQLPVKPDALDVFLVARLGDVDVPGEQIRGVHWRAHGQRFLILSRIAPPFVLAHELGHYLGLPHGDHPQSVMNKAPREQPPWEERVFVQDELDAMRPVFRKLLRQGRWAPLEAAR